MRRVSLAIGVTAAFLAACGSDERIAETQRWMEQQLSDVQPSFKPPEPIVEPKAPEAGLASMPDPFASDTAAPRNARR